MNLEKSILGIELGSTRIKAVLIDENHLPIASGSYSWENRLENGVWKGTLDLRCPVTADLEELKRRVKEHLPGFTVELTEEKAPHHVPADSELVRAVLAAYEEETGLKGEAESTGGGTYAKVLKQGVAFGAQFPDQPDLAHQPDEFIEIDRMLLAAKIYANTLIRLAAE